MIEEEDIGLLKANKTHDFVLQLFYAGRLALLVDLVRGMNTRKPEEVIEVDRSDKRKPVIRALPQPEMLSDPS
jgi:hypothetical protein